MRFMRPARLPLRLETVALALLAFAAVPAVGHAHLTASAPAGRLDTTPPTVPGRFSALVSETSVHLSWDPSFDAGGPAAYVIQRNGVEIGTTAGTLYIDSNLERGRLYVYRVRARDRAGNTSGAAEFAVTVPALPATPPPAVPGPGNRAGPALIAAPRIAGRARVGARLVVRAGRWSGASPQRSYQWLRCRPPAGACSVIVQARRASYRPTRFDVGFMLRVVETAANGMGRATAASRPSVRVKA
jgi:hypothetical protein